MGISVGLANFLRVYGIPVLTFAIGSLMTWLLSRPARKLANLEYDEKIQRRQDRSIGQHLLVISSVYRQYAGHPNLFSEEEMREWLRGEEPLRLHAALRFNHQANCHKPLLQRQV